MQFKNRKLALLQKPQESKRILPFITTQTQYHPSVTYLKQIPMKDWHLIELQPLLKEIYKNRPLICYKRGRSIKDILVIAKLQNWKAKTRTRESWKFTGAPRSVRGKANKLKYKDLHGNPDKRLEKIIIPKKSQLNSLTLLPLCVPSSLCGSF